MRCEIKGDWDKGHAFDVHSLASKYLGPNEYGYDQYDSTRSEMGQLVYNLKYNGEKAAVQEIVKLLKDVTGIENFDAIIPVPSSKKSLLDQPVDEIARALGAQPDVKVLIGYLGKKAGGAKIKNLTNPDEKSAALEGAITITGDADISGKRVLILDDVYDSGKTLNACCKVLRKNTKVAGIHVLTMTKTKGT